jgi:hypothetical protein
MKLPSYFQIEPVGQCNALYDVLNPFGGPAIMVARPVVLGDLHQIVASVWHAPSFDGWSCHRTYEQIRIRGHFDRVLRNIK